MADLHSAETLSNGFGDGEDVAVDVVEDAVVIERFDVVNVEADVVEDVIVAECVVELEDGIATRHFSALTRDKRYKKREHF